jgi:hypothetical protein
MTNQAKLMRAANALCKNIRRLREENAKAKNVPACVSITRAIVGRGTR